MMLGLSEYILQGVSWSSTQPPGWRDLVIMLASMMVLLPAGKGGSPVCFLKKPVPVGDSS